LWEDGGECASTTSAILNTVERYVGSANDMSEEVGVVGKCLRAAVAEEVEGAGGTCILTNIKVLNVKLCLDQHARLLSAIMENPS
jgi:hypothetical protein